MSEKLDFQSLVKYGFEMVLAQISLIVFSIITGALITAWLGTAIPGQGESKLFGITTIMIAASTATYTLFLPAMLYKIIVDAKLKSEEIKIND